MPPNPNGPPEDPFTGTPADNWADGAAGILLPKAEPVGGYSAAQVEDAYQTTKELLVAGYLDKQTLLGGKPAAFEDLLTRGQRAWFVANLNKKGVDKQGSPVSSLALILAFQPGHTQLIGGVIKVHGTMSAATSVTRGQEELDVHVDYLFTYPVEPPGVPTRWTRVVAEAVWTVAYGYWRGSSSKFGPWVEDTGGSVSGGLCGTTDGYVHPAYPLPRVVLPNSSLPPSGKPVNPYALHGTRNSAAGCQATTGT